MLTRSQHRLTLQLDFDEASRAWNLNKRKLRNGCYEYVQPETTVSRTKTQTVKHPYNTRSKDVKTRM